MKVRNIRNIMSQNTGHSLVSHRSEFQHVMTEIRNNPVKFLEENLILNQQCYAHHDEISLQLILQERMAC